MGTRENQPDEAEIYTPPHSPRGDLNNNTNNSNNNNTYYNNNNSNNKNTNDSENQYKINTAKILVAEDDQMYQLVAKRLLSRLGHSVTIAKNGKKAVEEATSGNYDFILMDVEMPEMDGLEATGKIRQFEKNNSNLGKRIPIIAYTTSDRSRCMGADMDDHLLKPASVEALKSIISLFTSSKRSIPA